MVDLIPKDSVDGLNKMWCRKDSPPEGRGLDEADIVDDTVQQREILALRFFAGHSYEEIAGITGVPTGTVKSRIFYALKSCQERLKERGIFK